MPAERLRDSGSGRGTYGVTHRHNLQTGEWTGRAAEQRTDEYGATIHRVRTRLFDHIDLRVRDRARAQKFYSAILPALGFEQEKSDEEGGVFYAKSDGAPVEFFGFTEDAHHVPNDTRIAFWADTPEEVDRIAEVVREAGGRNLEGPQIWTEYTPGYYALFFEDPDGNKLEVCNRGRSLVAG